MNDLNLPNARSLSRLGPRGTFGTALFELAKANQSIVALTADLAVTAGLDRFRKTFPERFVNVGIAEQNLIGVAAGLANDGWTPFAATFANFAAFRANEFVRHHLGYMQQPLTVIGIGAGFAMGQFGTTHYSLEDVGALRSIPNLTIASPSDCSELVTMLIELAREPRPIYLRLGGVPGMPPIETNPKEFEFGKARVISSGDDVTIFASGTMVHRATIVADQLINLGISSGVTNIHTLKPLDSDAVISESESRSLVVSIEEHSVIGGLGSAISEVLASTLNAPPIVRLGVQDDYPAVGSYEFVLTQVGLSVDDIRKSIVAKLKQ